MVFLLALWLPQSTAFGTSKFWVILLRIPSMWWIISLFGFWKFYYNNSWWRSISFKNCSRERVHVCECVREKIEREAPPLDLIFLQFSFCSPLISQVLSAHMLAQHVSDQSGWGSGLLSVRWLCSLACYWRCQLHRLV